MFMLYIYGLPSLCALSYYVTTHYEYRNWLILSPSMYSFTSFITETDCEKEPSIEYFL